MKSRICSLAGILLMAAVILVFLPLTVPRLFGYQIYGILTDSMEPNYPAGCVVYVKETDSAGIRVGDVITFQMGTDTDLVMTHRVAEIDVEKQQFITKGDANRAVDVTPVAFDRLIGEVVFQIPMLGNLSSCLYTGTGIMACSGLFVTVAVLWGIAEKFKLKESAK